MLVDSHCHLDFPDFENELDDVVARASDAGIKYMVTICTKVREFDRIHSVAERYENIYCSCLLYTSPSPRDRQKSRMPSSA